MGISGLLQFIRDASEPINILKYKGLTVAVDTYCWLHKGAFSCAEKLAKGEATEQYVWYCMKFVDMLLGFNIKPILVFDGRNLPSKQEVEKSRRERREANLRRGRQLLREGKVSEARDCFTRCVNITPAMAHNLIKVARARGVDCIVAPYEADAQLAYLTKAGLAHAVITEDSDLLAFGCKKVILKMDKHGNGLEIDQDNFGRCRSLGNIFTEEKFRYMCILSGCDYLPSLPGIGLGKACKMLRLATEPDIIKVIRKMGHYLKMSLTVPEEYVEGFIRANNTFLYQLVFDPVRRKVVPLNPYPLHLDVNILSYAGLHFGDDRDLQLAVGNLDLNNMERIDDFDPDKQISAASKRRWSDVASPGGSIWSRVSQPGCDSKSKLSNSASPSRPSQPIEEERVTSRRTPCRELQVKRPREDMCLTDEDLVQQYLTSNHKRTRSNKLSDSAASNKKPRPCGVFATHLQRRNGEATDDCQATCSRFFSRCNSAVKKHLEPSGSSLAPPGSVKTQTVHTNAPLISTPSSSASPPQSSASPPQSPPQSSASPPQSSASPPQSSASPATASQDLHSSANSTSKEASGSSRSTLGWVALQHFKYHKTFSCHTKTQRSSIAPYHSGPSAGLNDDLQDSPPPPEDQISHCEPPGDNLPPPPDQLSASELISSRRLEQRSSSPHTDEAQTLEISKPKVLDQSGGFRQQQQQKMRVGGGTRVSGLRRRSAPKEKLSSRNNENKPHLQATISNLWKNFAFQLERQKM